MTFLGVAVSSERSPDRTPAVPSDDETNLEHPLSERSNGGEEEPSMAAATSSTRREEQLVSCDNIVAMMSQDVRNSRAESLRLRQELARLKEKHRRTKRRLNETLSLAVHTSRPHSPSSSPPDRDRSTLPPHPGPASPAFLEARKHIAFLNDYSVPPEWPFVLPDLHRYR